MRNSPENPLPYVDLVTTYSTKNKDDGGEEILCFVKVRPEQGRKEDRGVMAQRIEEELKGVACNYCMMKGTDKVKFVYGMTALGKTVRLWRYTAADDKWGDLVELANNGESPKPGHPLYIDVYSSDAWLLRKAFEEMKQTTPLPIAPFESRSIEDVIDMKEEQEQPRGRTRERDVGGYKIGSKRSHSSHSSSDELRQSPRNSVVSSPLTARQSPITPKAFSPETLPCTPKPLPLTPERSPLSSGPTSPLTPIAETEREFESETDYPSDCWSVDPSDVEEPPRPEEPLPTIRNVRHKRTESVRLVTGVVDNYFLQKAFDEMKV